MTMPNWETPQLKVEWIDKLGPVDKGYINIINDYLKTKEWLKDYKNDPTKFEDKKIQDAWSNLNAKLTTLNLKPTFIEESPSNEKNAMIEKEIMNKKIDETINKDKATWDKFETFFQDEDSTALKNALKNAIDNYTNEWPKKTNEQLELRLNNAIKKEKSHINRYHVFEEFTKIIPDYDETKDGDDLKNLLRMTSKEYPNRPKDEYPPANQIMYMLKSGKYDANMIKGEVLKNIRDAFVSNWRKNIPWLSFGIDTDEPEQINLYNQNTYGTDKANEVRISKTLSKNVKETFKLDFAQIDKTIDQIRKNNEKPTQWIIPKEIQIHVPQRIADDAMFNTVLSNGKYQNRKTIKISELSQYKSKPGDILIVIDNDVNMPKVKEVRDKVEIQKKSEKIMFDQFEPNVIDSDATKMVGNKINDLIKNPDKFTKRKIDDAIITWSASHNPTEYKPIYNNIVLPKNIALNDVTPNIWSTNNKDLAKDRALEIYSKLPSWTNATINYWVFWPTPDSKEITDATDKESREKLYKPFQNSTLDITYTDTITKPDSKIYDSGLWWKEETTSYSIFKAKLDYKDKRNDLLKKDGIKKNLTPLP